MAPVPAPQTRTVMSHSRPSRPLGSRNRRARRAATPMNIVVFGANGPTGRLVVEQANAAGHKVPAVTRHPDTFPVPGARVVEADVYDPRAVEHAVAGQDTVISALGVPYSRNPVGVYSTGITHITQAMAEHGVSRL